MATEVTVLLEYFVPDILQEIKKSVMNKEEPSLTHPYPPKKILNVARQTLSKILQIVKLQC